MGANNKTALIHFGSKNFNILIPRLNGKGYLKNPLGGHHHTETGERWMKNLNDAEIYIGDWSDVDDYIWVSVDPDLSGTIEFRESFMEALKLTFPKHIQGFTELDNHSFMNRVIFNI